VLDDGLRLSGLGSALSPLRNGVAGVVAFASVLMAFVLLFIPQLPRRVLLPPVLFALWCAIGAPPLDMTQATGPILGVLQLAIALGAFVMVNVFGGRWLLYPDQLPVRGHLVVRTLAALAVTLVALLLLAVSGTLYAFAHQIETMSNHYVQFNAGGLDVQETTLRKGPQTVYLVGMMHVGEASAYEKLFASMPEKALVFPEGVSDTKNLLAGKFNYRRVARVLGLEQQPDIAAVESTASPAPDSGEESRYATGPVAQSDRHILRADVDVSDFSPVTLRFLTELGELYASPTLGDAVSRFRGLSDHYTESEIASVFDDILIRRNEHLLASFDANAMSYDTVIIPWGALHMPGLEAALTARGYAATERRTIRLVNYGTLLSAVAARF